MDAVEARGSGYRELIRGNRDFRRLWIADVASLFGDWLNTIALYTLVRQLTPSPFALGLVLLIKVLPFAFASPFAGFLVDRFDRRWLMIVADLVRAAVVLGFVLVDDPSHLPTLYTLAALQMMVSAVFIPARSAVIPNITTPAELLTANALSAMTWSSLLAIGAALGGFATAGFGVKTVFVLDSATYLVSAVFVFGVRVPPRQSRRRARPGVVREIVEGWRYLRRHPPVRRMAGVKALWASAGGGLVYLMTLLGERLPGVEPAVGIGLLYAARGIGTGVGPIFVRNRFPIETAWPRVIGIGIVASGFAYATVGGVPWGLWLIGLIGVAHAPSGANWVLSTVLLQRRTIDEFRGRVFATEWLFVTLADALSILAASLALETGWLTLRQTILVLAGLLVVAGCAWLRLVVPRERREREAVRRAG